MKTLLFLLPLVLITAPVQAQRIFRASSIDLEQNDRLDVLEAKFSAIENSINKLSVAIETASAKEVVTVAVTEKPKTTEVATSSKPVVLSPPTVIYSQPATVSYTPPVPTQKIVTTSSGYYDGTSQRTYPGDIRSHLQGTHGVGSTAGMTKDQMEALHDSLHNGSRSVSRSRTVTRSVQQSACPGGVCPSPASRSTVRRGIFGWRR
jgi:hypothetical protein